MKILKKTVFIVYFGDYPSVVTADVLHRKWSLPSSQLVYGAGFIRYVAEYQEPLAEADVFSLLLSAVSAWKQTSSGWHMLFPTTGVRVINGVHSGGIILTKT